MRGDRRRINNILVANTLGSILQVGCFGTDNLGDEMGAAEVRRHLRARWPGLPLRFAMVSRDPEHSARCHPEVTSFYTEDQLAGGQVPLRDFPLIVLGPGTLLGRKIIRSARFLLRRLRPPDRRLFIWGCGVEPIPPGGSARDLARLCSLAQRVTVRNQRCAQYLANAGITDRVGVTADPLFSATVPAHQPKGMITVTICEKMLRLPWVLKRSFIEPLARALERYCSETGSAAAFLPMRVKGHKPWRSDLDYAELLRRLLPRDLRIVTENSPAAALDQLAATDLYIGTRLHGCLLAAVVGCRVIGIGSLEKMRQLFDDLAMQTALLSPRQASDPDILYKAMQSARPANPQTLAHLRIRSQSTVHLVSLEDIA